MLLTWAWTLGGGSIIQAVSIFSQFITSADLSHLHPPTSTIFYLFSSMFFHFMNSFWNFLCLCWNPLPLVYLIQWTLLGLLFWIPLQVIYIALLCLKYFSVDLSITASGFMPASLCQDLASLGEPEVMNSQQQLFHLDWADLGSDLSFEITLVCWM